MGRGIMDRGKVYFHTSAECNRRTRGKKSVFVLSLVFKYLIHRVLVSNEPLLTDVPFH